MGCTFQAPPLKVSLKYLNPPGVGTVLSSFYWLALLGKSTLPEILELYRALDFRIREAEVFILEYRIRAGRAEDAVYLQGVVDTASKLSGLLKAAQHAYFIEYDMLEQNSKRTATSVVAVNYDPMVKDPALLPKPIAALYIKHLKAMIGRGTKVTLIKSETTMPRGWDSGNYTVLEVTPPGAPEGIKVAVTTNIAQGDEVSGSAVLDAPYGVIPGQRAKNNTDTFIVRLSGEIANLLRRKKTAMFKQSSIDLVAARFAARFAAQFASFTKLKDGNWGLRVPGSVSPGKSVEVLKKDGTRSSQVVGKVVWSGTDPAGNRISLCTIGGTSGGSKPSTTRYECEECREYVTPGTRCWETGMTH